MSVRAWFTQSDLKAAVDELERLRVKPCPTDVRERTPQDAKDRSDDQADSNKSIS